MKKLNIIKCQDKNTLSLIQKYFDLKHYNTHQDLIYEGHIPHVGVLLSEGCISLFQRNRKKEELTKGALLGVQELLNNNPSKYTVHIHPGAEVCLIDKSSLQEALKHNDHALHQLVKELLS